MDRRLQTLLVSVILLPRGTVIAMAGMPFFLTGRRNPPRYSFLPFGIRDAETVAALKTLREFDLYVAP